MWSRVLDISAAMLLLGLFLAGAYEAIAIINLRLPFTPDLPLITHIVRPLIAKQKDFALAVAAMAFAAQFWLFFHFFLNL